MISSSDLAGRDAFELLPEFEIENRAALTLPALRLPPGEPFVHALHQILAVGDHFDSAASVQEREPLDTASDGHSVVGGVPLR